MTPEYREFAHSLKLAVVAVICALGTATLVIGAGQAILRHYPPAASAEGEPLLVHLAG